MNIPVYSHYMECKERQGRRLLIQGEGETSPLSFSNPIIGNSILG